MVKINFVSELSENEEAFIENEHEQYENQNEVSCNYTPFSFVAKNEEDVVGIIGGYTCYEEVYIDDLVVGREYRKNGVGKELVSTVEKHFSNKGFNNINLVTNKFQAPEFYEKCGFELEFVRKNIKNPKLDKYFFVKYLD